VRGPTGPAGATGVCDCDSDDDCADAIRSTNLSEVKLEKDWKLIPVTFFVMTSPTITLQNNGIHIAKIGTYLVTYGVTIAFTDNVTVESGLLYGSTPLPGTSAHTEASQGILTVTNTSVCVLEKEDVLSIRARTFQEDDRKQDTRALIPKNLSTTAFITAVRLHRTL
jgi:hypothetical protein